MESLLIQKCVDSKVSAFRTEDVLHAEVHEGSVFNVAKSTSVLGASSYIDISIYTPSSSIAEIHLKELFMNNSAGIGQILLYEPASTNGSTATVGGTTVVSFNHNRNSTRTAYSAFDTGVTNLPAASTVTSTQYKVIISEYFGTSGTAANKVGMFYQPNLEMILKYNTTYILRLWNYSASAGYATMKIFFYEDYTTSYRYKIGV